MSSTFFLASNYEATFDRQIKLFKDRLAVTEEGKKKILKNGSTLRLSKKTIEFDLKHCEIMSKYSANSLKMYSLEKMLWKMLITPPKDNAGTITENMRKKFYEASSNAMESVETLVEMGIQKEEMYLETCNQYKLRMNQFIDMCDALKDGDFDVIQR